MSTLLSTDLNVTRSTTRRLAPPGGGSSISLAGQSPAKSGDDMVFGATVTRQPPTSVRENHPTGAGHISFGASEDPTATPKTGRKHAKEASSIDLSDGLNQVSVAAVARTVGGPVATSRLRAPSHSCRPPLADSPKYRSNSLTSVHPCVHPQEAVESTAPVAAPTPVVAASVAVAAAAPKYLAEIKVREPLKGPRASRRTGARAPPHARVGTYTRVRQLACSSCDMLPTVLAGWRGHCDDRGDERAAPGLLL